MKNLSRDLPRREFLKTAATMAGVAGATALTSAAAVAKRGRGRGSPISRMRCVGRSSAAWGTGGSSA